MSLAKTLDDYADSAMLSVAEAAEALKISRDTAYELIRQGKIPAVHLTEKIIRVPAYGLRQWIARESGTAAPPAPVQNQRH